MNICIEVYKQTFSLIQKQSLLCASSFSGCFNRLCFLGPTDAVRLKGLGQWLASVPPTTQTDSADLQLAVGAIIIEEMRASVEQCTGFQCSAGISHNKVQ